MKIWQREINLTLLNTRGKNTLAEFLGIEFIAITDNALSAIMPIDHRTQQPLGILHGGASCALAETIGSTAANFTVTEHNHCVGLELNINHLRAGLTGYVTAVTKPYHLGKSTQVWSIKIFNTSQQLLAISRLTLAVKSS